MTQFRLINLGTWLIYGSLLSIWWNNCSHTGVMSSDLSNDWNFHLLKSILSILLWRYWLCSVINYFFTSDHGLVPKKLIQHLVVYYWSTEVKFEFSSTAHFWNWVNDKHFQHIIAINDRLKMPFRIILD